MAKLIFRRALHAEYAQGWHITVLSEAARYGWQPPIRDKQVKANQMFSEDVNAAMDYLIRLLPDQYQLEVERG